MQGGRGAGAKGQILALKPRRGRESDPDSDPHSPFNVYPHGKQSSYTTRQLGRIQRDGETEIRQGGEGPDKKTRLRRDSFTSMLKKNF